jgi:hypothetical protein
MWRELRIGRFVLVSRVVAYVPPMSLDLETISRLVANCDPQKPLEDHSPFYVPLDRDPSVRGDRACIDQLERTILHAGSASCQLFTGFPGTGKTTELRRLAARFSEAQAPRDGHVLVIDFNDYINRFQPISISDVLRVLTYCLVREADRVEAKLQPELQGERYLRTFFRGVLKALPTGAALKSADFELFGAKLMFEMRNNHSFRDQMEQGILASFQHFVDECKKFVSESIARIRAAAGSRANRFIVIADGLEKLDAIDEGKRDVIEGTIESLFVVHSEFLRLPCHVIYTFPIWLRFRTAQLGAVYNREPVCLPMVKVREERSSDKPPDQRAAYEPGLAKLYEVIRRRLGDPAQVFGADPEAALRPLLEASGGYPRDALRMVRNLLQSEENFPVASVVVSREIRSLRQSYHDTVLGTHTELLMQIDRTGEIPNTSLEELRHFGHLFSRSLILAYRNGREWFDVHPLVRDAPALVSRTGKRPAP